MGEGKQGNNCSHFSSTMVGPSPRQIFKEGRICFHPKHCLRAPSPHSLNYVPSLATPTPLVTPAREPHPSLPCSSLLCWRLHSPKTMISPGSRPNSASAVVLTVNWAMRGSEIMAWADNKTPIPHRSLGVGMQIQWNLMGQIEKFQTWPEIASFTNKQF